MKKFTIGSHEIRDEPDDLLKLLDLMPNLENLDVRWSFDFNLENPDETDKKLMLIVEIYKQVKSTFKFHLAAFYVRDDKLLFEGLKSVFAEILNRFSQSMGRS